jgi:hypothetical protein
MTKINTISTTKKPKKRQWSASASLVKLVMWPYPQNANEFKMGAGYDCITFYSFLHYDKQSFKKAYEALHAMAFKPDYRGKMKTVKLYNNATKETLATYIDGIRKY